LILNSFAEATAEILPRLCQIKFDRGVIDEHLFLDMPHEYRLSTGIMVLEYAKAVQESVYEHVRVIHEGRLRIIFTPELKVSAIYSVHLFPCYWQVKKLF
jgi:LIM-domain binding protein